MNYDLTFAIIFYALFYFLFFKFRSRFDVQGKIFILYRAQWGIRLMDYLAKKFPRFLHILSYLNIFLGFTGMGVIFFFLVKGTYSLLFHPAAVPILSPVIPGVETVPGAPILSFWHWIISILVLAIIHEFMHGVYARSHKIPIKSTGFAFLGPLLAAFVEPDEKILNKKKALPQLAIISAGPVSNLITALFIGILVLFVFQPLALRMITTDGVFIASISPDLPLSKTVITAGTEIIAIDHARIHTYKEFVTLLDAHKPGDVITITTNTTTDSVLLTANPKSPTKPLLGVMIQPARVTLSPFLQTYPFLYTAYLWFVQLLFWLFTISLGVGLFNLLPLGPVDGGRMFLVAATAVLNNKTKAQKVWLFFSLLCALLILINLFPFLMKFFKYIFTPIQYLLTLIF